MRGWGGRGRKAGRHDSADHLSRRNSFPYPPATTSEEATLQVMQTCEVRCWRGPDTERKHVIECGKLKRLLDRRKFVARPQLNSCSRGAQSPSRDLAWETCRDLWGLLAKPGSQNFGLEPLNRYVSWVEQGRRRRKQWRHASTLYRTVFIEQVELKDSMAILRCKTQWAT